MRFLFTSTTLAKEGFVLMGKNTKFDMRTKLFDHKLADA